MDRVVPPGSGRQLRTWGSLTSDGELASGQRGLLVPSLPAPETPVPTEFDPKFPCGTPVNRPKPVVPGEEKHERVEINRKRGVFSVGGKWQTEGPLPPEKPEEPAP